MISEATANLAVKCNSHIAASTACILIAYTEKGDITEELCKEGIADST